LQAALVINNKKKIFKIGFSLYVLIFTFFYIERANDYLFEDRAYKEAKSYAIAGEYLFLWQALVLNLSSPESLVYKPINLLQKYILKNIREIIPKDDAEYEIWNYKFNLIAYARTMYAPMTEKSKQRGLHFTNPAASMKPELIEVLNSIYHSMKNLNDKTIKDQQFSQIDRYLVIAGMIPYYEDYFPYMGNLESNTKIKNYYGKKIRAFWNTPKYKTEFENYLKIIDNIKLVKEKDEKLSKAFEEHPRLKASYYWGGVRAYITYIYMQTNKGIYPCTNPNFLKFVANYKEYVSWAYMTNNSSFNSLSRRERKSYTFKIENRENGYYIAKYICKIPFKYMIKGEASIETKYREKSFSRSLERREIIRNIREIEKQLNIGENNVKQ
jgi:hypothetical protein